MDVDNNCCLHHLGGHLYKKYNHQIFYCCFHMLCSFSTVLLFYCFLTVRSIWLYKSIIFFPITILSFTTMLSATSSIASMDYLERKFAFVQPLEWYSWLDKVTSYTVIFSEKWLDILFPFWEIMTIGNLNHITLTSLEKPIL